MIKLLQRITGEIARGLYCFKKCGLLKIEYSEAMDSESLLDVRGRHIEPPQRFTSPIRNPNSGEIWDPVSIELAHDLR